MPYIDRDDFFGSFPELDIESYKSFPTADVVEVVRCKDCIHGIPTRIDTVTGEFSDERHCNRNWMCHFEDYYCADGKRKETDG